MSSPTSHFDPAHYQEQLQCKLAAVAARFSDFSLPFIEVFVSPTTHYRLRAEFKVWWQDRRASYAMYQPGKYKQHFLVDEFLVGSERINALMPPLLQAVNASDVLGKRLFAVEFLTTLSDEALITLLYHRPLDDAWLAEAKALSKALSADIIGRSRKRKLLTGRDHVVESLEVEGESYRFTQMETGFTQPNGRVNEQMIAWAQRNSRNIGGDLLELYCGNGNFTVPLAQNFNRVLATEVSKLSVRSAIENIELNDVTNIEVVRLSSEEMAQALAGIRPFRRLAHLDLADYRFSTIFVDPPRAGLDDVTLELLPHFDHIVYISCNPETMARNIATIAADYRIERFALFDQFPYTEHAECGALLVRR